MESVQREGKYELLCPKSVQRTISTVQLLREYVLPEQKCVRVEISSQQPAHFRE